MGRTASIGALALVLAACLPGDTRPLPASVYVTAEPGAALTGGFDTADGWRVGFDRFVAAVGNVDFENDDAACNSYAEARYDRLFDFKVAGREKVGTVYGLGTCRIEFRFRDPSFEALLGPGATTSDLAFMRIEQRDRFSGDEAEGVSLWIVGQATRGDVTKRFEWVFRHSYELTDCPVPGGGFATTVALASGIASELRIEVRAEALFRASGAEDAELRFEPFAEADADADGAITLDELAVVPRPLVAPPMAAPTAGSAPWTVGAPPPNSLEALVYLDLLPNVLGVVGAGRCLPEVR